MRRSGVSLVEIVLALLLVSLALIPIFSLIQSGTRQTRFNEEHAIATLLAVQVLERFRGEPLEWLGAELANERGDLIESDPVLTPPDDPDAAGWRQILAGYRRSVRCVAGERGTRVLIAKVTWERVKMPPQSVERTLVLAPNAALGAQP